MWLCTYGHNLHCEQSEFNVAKQAAGVDIEPIETNGGADSAYTTYLGIPTICSVGPYGTGIHSTEEKCISRVFRARSYTGCIVM